MITVAREIIILEVCAGKEMRDKGNLISYLLSMTDTVLLKRASWCY